MKGALRCLLYAINLSPEGGSWYQLWDFILYIHIYIYILATVFRSQSFVQSCVVHQNKCSKIFWLSLQLTAIFFPGWKLFLEIGLHIKKKKFSLTWPTSHKFLGYLYLVQNYQPDVSLGKNRVNNQYAGSMVCNMGLHLAFPLPCEYSNIVINLSVRLPLSERVHEYTHVCVSELMSDVKEQKHSNLDQQNFMEVNSDLLKHTPEVLSAENF